MPRKCIETACSPRCRFVLQRFAEAAIVHPDGRMRRSSIGSDVLNKIVLGMIGALAVAAPAMVAVAPAEAAVTTQASVDPALDFVAYYHRGFHGHRGFGRGGFYHHRGFYHRGFYGRRFHRHFF